ncbi:MAG: OmpA family protein [Rhodobacteraceae bacterium]|nr:OmpA family protein [Paracoccaceae bacterium]
MRLPRPLLFLLVMSAAAGLSAATAFFAVDRVEAITEIDIRRTLDVNDHGWAEVEADGLQVILSGTAPDEAARFVALSDISAVIDPARIRNNIDVRPTAAPEPPRFAIEILRNDSGLSVIGLIPADLDRRDLVLKLTSISGDLPMRDLLQTADYPIPSGWSAAMSYALAALQDLPRAKISISADHVLVSAIADTIAEQRALESELRRAAPATLPVTIEITAPRPVITPFSLRFVLDMSGGRFDSCSADTEAARTRILDAARAAGLRSPVTCVIGLGVPSPSWARAVEQALAALKELGAGSVTFANADLLLVAPVGTDQTLFDRVVGELDAALPAVFALTAQLPHAEEETEGETPEFFGTLDPDGALTLRGRLNDAVLRDVVNSYAGSRFGRENVDMGARLVEGMPIDWSLRVLTGLEALSLLSEGKLDVTPELITLSGRSALEDAPARVSRLVADRLGSGQNYELAIVYDPPPPPPEEVKPDPDQCLADVRAAHAANKITFDPGSPSLASSALTTVNEIAAILRDCPGIPLEIQGHTDSQGREEMNQQLSQARAQSVLNALRARRVLTSGYVANGYGEATPIAENDTEEGREANRRIEFYLISEEPAPEETEATGETAPDAETDDADAGSDAPDDAAEDTQAEETASQDDPAPEEEPTE